MSYYFYVYSDTFSKHWFREAEIKEANRYAQELANKWRVTVYRRDVYGGASAFYPEQ